LHILLPLHATDRRGRSLIDLKTKGCLTSSLFHAIHFFEIDAQHQGSTHADELSIWFLLLMEIRFLKNGGHRNNVHDLKLAVVATTVELPP
jgi:hypothetical protein